MHRYHLFAGQVLLGLQADRRDYDASGLACADAGNMQIADDPCNLMLLKHDGIVPFSRCSCCAWAGLEFSVGRPQKTHINKKALVEAWHFSWDDIEIVCVRLKPAAIPDEA